MSAKHFFPVVPGGAPSHLAVTVARNVRKLRTEKGYSLEKLAELGNVDTPTLSRLEAGEGHPSLNFAWRVARALGVPFTALTAG